MIYSPHLQDTMSQGRGNIWEGSGKRVHWFILAYLLLLALPCTGFLPNFWSRVLTLSWKSHTHQYITEQSILNVTLETLRGTKKHHAEEEVSSQVDESFIALKTARLCSYYIVIFEQRTTSHSNDGKKPACIPRRPHWAVASGELWEKW